MTTTARLPATPPKSQPQGNGLRIVYFVHNLNDPAVAKRLLMLHAAGFETILAGFWRGASPPSEIAGARTVPLGRTFDSRLVHRGLVTARHALASRKLLQKLGPADLFLARNLEMLAIAVAVKGHATGPLAVIYEVLDIHRSLLSTRRIGKIARLIERILMSKTDHLITSSPAFLREYFETVQFPHHRLPTNVIENKMLRLQFDDTAKVESELASGPPWRIGWFGMIRCRRSLEMLRNLASKRPDLVQIEICGRPAQSVFGNFENGVQAVPALHFGGAYAQAELERLYASVHFNWAIDYFEENGNSEWLLPNRIYEGGSFNAIPFALRRAETGRWLKAMHLGVLMDDPAVELESFLERLTPVAFRTLKDAARNAPRTAFIADQSDCNRMASVLNDVVRLRQRAWFMERASQLA